jgi:AcrR family transcriptional regulator
MSNDLDVAFELFYWDEIYTTAVDRVAAEARVSPTTLYRLFDSTDDLVNAYVTRTASGYREALAEATDPSKGSARKRILAIFDVIEEQAQPHNCNGRPFLMALAEYPDASAPAHATAVEPKTWVRSRLQELTGELGVGEQAEVLGDTATTSARRSSGASS